MRQKSIITRVSSIPNSSFLTPNCLKGWIASQRSRVTGFTLAEVLITLVVLGIIAAVTIPTLRNSLDDKRYRVPLKKTYAVLSEAFDMILSLDDVDVNYNTADSKNDVLVKKLIDKLGASKVCCATGKKLGEAGCYWGKGDRVVDCFGSRPTNPDGTTHYGFITNDLTTYPSAIFTLKDGTSVLIDTCYNGGNYLESRYGLNSSFRTSSSPKFFIIYIDVNGKTGPNVAGKDLHTFVYTTSHGLIPSGADYYDGSTLSHVCANGKAACTYDYLMGEEE